MVNSPFSLLAVRQVEGNTDSDKKTLEAVNKLADQDNRLEELSIKTEEDCGMVVELNID